MTPASVVACPGGRAASSASTSARIERMGGQCTSGPRALAARARPCAGRRAGRRGSRSASATPRRAHRVPDGSPSHSSASGVGAQTGTSSAVVGDEPAGMHELEQPGRAGRVDVEALAEATQVADGQPPGPQHARRRGTPPLDDLLDEVEQVADRATRGVVDQAHPDLGADRRGRGQRPGLVQPASTQPQRDLARAAPRGTRRSPGAARCRASTRGAAGARAASARRRTPGRRG